jgi:SNF2 family DNA or RNA helicase
MKKTLEEMMEEDGEPIVDTSDIPEQDEKFFAKAEKKKFRPKKHYPILGTLRDHQVRALDEAGEKAGHAWFMDAGGGKTLTAIAEIGRLYENGKIDGVIVIAPMGPHEQWIDEQFPLWSGYRYTAIHNKQTPTQIKKFLEGRQTRLGVLAINYDALRTPKGQALISAFRKKFPRIYLVIDESHKIKNPRAQRTKETLALALQSEYRRLLTGTPILKGLEDLWSQYEAVEAGLGWDHQPIALQKNGKVNTYGYIGYRAHYCKLAPVPSNPRASRIVGYRNEEELRVRVRPFSTRVMADEFMKGEKPDFIKVRCEMSAQQKTAYLTMREHLLAMVDSGTITASNALVQMSKLQQIACLAGDTEVLTDRGWIALTSVEEDDKVWDGIEWVRHQGLQDMGIKHTLHCAGVRMTSDHLVLTSGGWRDAQSCEGLNRSEVRLPDGRIKTWLKQQASHMALSLRLRFGSHPAVPVFEAAGSWPASLWMLSRKQDTRQNKHKAVQHLVSRKASLHLPYIEGLAALWRGWGHHVRQVGRVIHGVCHGHGANLRGWAYAGPDQPPRPVFPRELPLGNHAHSAEQPPRQPMGRNATRSNASNGSGSRISVDRSNLAAAPEQVWDLRNAGPRHRFTVRPAGGGEPIVVHNCGFLIDENKQITEIGSNKIDAAMDLIEQLDEPVIIWAPFVHLQTMMRERLIKEGLEEHIYSRDGVEAWKKDRRGILVGNQTSGLGVGMNLQHAAANIYLTNSFSSEARWQSVKRTDRIGQKHQVRVWDLIAPKTTDDKVLAALAAKEEISNRTIDGLRDMLL